MLANARLIHAIPPLTRALQAPRSAMYLLPLPLVGALLHCSLPAMIGPPGDKSEGVAQASRNCCQCSVQSTCPVATMLIAPIRPLDVREHSFRPGDVLQDQGATATGLRILKSGATMVWRASQYGNPRPVGILGRGTVIGTFGLLGRVSPLRYVGVLEGRFCEISTAALATNGLLQDPVFMGHLAMALADTVESHFNWCQLRYGEGVSQQLAGALLHLSNLQRSLRVRLPSQATLAALLDTTRESITRAFARLEKDGVVTRCGRYYCELHLPDLLRHVETGSPPLK